MRTPVFGECAIDSMKLRIELTDLDSYDSELLKHLQTVDVKTGEIVGEFKRKAIDYDIDEYTIKASIAEQVAVGKNRYADCLIILINSKHLGSGYFEGITKNSIKKIYSQLIEIGLLECSMQTFLNGSPTDTDFKVDYELLLDEYKELITTLKQHTKPSIESGRGCRPFNEKKNKGIQWSDRKTKAFKTNPFIKIYHKGLEMSVSKAKGGSLEFYDRYLKDYDLTNTFRIEVTVKNREHFKLLNLGLKRVTLGELLELNNDQKISIISSALTVHLMPRSKSSTFKKEKQLSPSENMIFRGLLLAVADLEMTPARAIETLLIDQPSSVAKSRSKKLLERLYTDHIMNTDYDTKSTKIDNVLDSLGWI